MWRTAIVSIALMFSSSIASAQQPCTTDARRVVDELYRHMLERGADAGAQHWQNELQSGRMTVRDVVRAIAMSPEYDQRFNYAESGEETPYIRSVNRLYRHILGRQPDAAGARSHAARVQRQGMTPVVDAILSSDEYSRRFGEWGVPGSGGLSFCATSGRSNDSNASAAQNTNMNPRFRNMDRNGDGVITQDEWTGNRNGFYARDENGDGILSDYELETRGARNSNREFGSVGTSGYNDNFIYVDARQRWTDTGIDVRAGETVAFDAQGNAQLSNNSYDTATPAGATSGRLATNAPVRRAPAGGLVARVGNSNAVFVGANGRMRAPNSGRLYLSVNDAYVGDNSGEYRVSVTVR